MFNMLMKRQLTVGNIMNEKHSKALNLLGLICVVADNFSSFYSHKDFILLSLYRSLNLHRVL